MIIKPDIPIHSKEFSFPASDRKEAPEDSYAVHTTAARLRHLPCQKENHTKTMEMQKFTRLCHRTSYSQLRQMIDDR